MSNPWFRFAPAVCCFALVAAGCDRWTPEKKGQDYAEEKLGFAQGAAKALEEKGKGLGLSVGKGLGDLVKGAGSGVKDAILTPVKVELGTDLDGSGVKVTQAHESDPTSNSRGVVVQLDFPQRFEGRLRLQAEDADKANLARADLADNVIQAAGGQITVTFPFSSDSRLSKVDHYVLHTAPMKSATLDAALGDAGISLSQLKEQNSEVSLYLVFAKPFSGGLQLRAKGADDQEIGRSEATEKLEQDADSARFFAFAFDSHTPLATATGYTLHSVAPKKP